MCGSTSLKEKRETNKEEREGMLEGRRNGRREEIKKVNKGKKRMSTRGKNELRKNGMRMLAEGGDARLCSAVNFTNSKRRIIRVVIPKHSILFFSYNVGVVS